MSFDACVGFGLTDIPELLDKTWEFSHVSEHAI